MEDFQEEEDIGQGRSCNEFLQDVYRSHLVAWLLLHCSAYSKSHRDHGFLELVLEYDHLLVACSQIAFLLVEQEEQNDG